MLLNYSVEKTFENPLDCKEIKPVIPKGNQSWIFIDAEAEVPMLWPPNAKSWDSKQKEKGVAKDEMVRYDHRLNGHESEQTPGAAKNRWA